MTSKQPNIKALRAESHALKPVVRLGNKGLTDAVHAEIDAALHSHELIKVKVVADRNDRSALIAAMAKKAEATVINAIGQICVLFRERPDAE